MVTSAKLWPPAVAGLKQRHIISKLLRRKVSDESSPASRLLPFLLGTGAFTDSDEKWWSNFSQLEAVAQPSAYSAVMQPTGNSNLNLIIGLQSDVVRVFCLAWGFNCDNYFWEECHMRIHFSFEIVRGKICNYIFKRKIFFKASTGKATSLFTNLKGFGTAWRRVKGWLIFFKTNYDITR